MYNSVGKRLLVLLSATSVCVCLVTVRINQKSKTLSMQSSRSKGPYIEDINLSDFYGNITIGTPPQPFSVLLTTDTTGIWVPSSLCPVDKYSMCKDHRRYNRNNSTTYIRGGQMFGYGHMVGELSYDTLCIGGQNVTNQSFAEAFQYMYNDDSIPYDGFLGLGQDQRIFSNDSSIFTNMKEQGVIDHIVFGIYYNKSASSVDSAGALLIGGRNSSLYKGSLVYVQCSNKYTWQFTVKNVVVHKSRMTPFCTDGCTAVPSSASHFITASHKLTQSLHKNLGAIVFADNYTYYFDCSNLESLQPIDMEIGGRKFYIPWHTYVDIVDGADGKEQCMSLIVGNDDFAGNGLTLGDAFFSSVYVEFDVDNSRLGFAQLIFSS